MNNQEQKLHDLIHNTLKSLVHSEQVRIRQERDADGDNPLTESIITRTI
jgi:stalled ribosome alternative rescue factor ArfA